MTQMERRRCPGSNPPPPALGLPLALRCRRYVVVGATVAAAVLTPSTDPFTQTLLAVPLVGLYLGGASLVQLLEKRREEGAAA